MELNLEPSWWSRNTGDINEEEDLLDPQFRAQQEHHAALQPTTTFTATPPTHLPLTCSTLILAADPLSSSFLRSTFFLPTSGKSQPEQPTLLATYLLQPRSLSSSSATSPSPASLSSSPSPSPYSCASFYSLPSSPSVVLGLNYAEVAAEAMTVWSEGLFDHIRADRVLVLDTCPLSSFISTDPSSAVPCPPLLFALQTSVSPPLPSSLSPLPPPNLLHSLSSALLIHCELSSIPSTLLVSFVSPHFTGESIAAFHALQAVMTSGVKVAKRGEREYEKDWNEVVMGIRKSNKKGGIQPGVGGASAHWLNGVNPDLFL
jgi:hypothetical protein